jgi:hypothetical protein
MDKVKSGEIQLGSAEVETKKADEGGIISTSGGLCGPCRIDNHKECEGVPCICVDPYHHQSKTQL